jgi:U3 small nucleolar RNA-associated protein 22
MEMDEDQIDSAASPHRSTLSSSSPSPLSELQDPWMRLSSLFDLQVRGADSRCVPIPFLRIIFIPLDLMDDGVCVQSEQLLPEYHPPHPVLHTVKKRCKAIADRINSLSECPLSSHRGALSEYEAWSESVLPSVLLDQGHTAATSLSFVPPQSVELTGVLALDWIDTAHLRADLLLRVPNYFVKSSDFRQYRYHQKRAAYLILLSHLISEALSETGSECSTHFDQSDSIKPTLILRIPLLHNASHLQLQIRLHFSVAAEMLKLNKLEPWKLHTDAVVREISESDPLSVKFLASEYNRSILDDALSLERTQYVIRALRGHESYRRAFVFLRAWFRARCEAKNIGIWTFLIVGARLHATRTITPDMTPVEIFRTILSWWVNSWPEAFLADTAPHAQSRQMWRQIYRVTLSDLSGRTNLASGASFEAWESLREDAATSLKYLSLRGAKDAIDVLPLSAFQALFQPRTEFNYDIVIKVFESVRSQFDVNDATMDKASSRHFADRQLVARLYAGFGTRVLRVQTLHSSNEEDILLGVVVRPDQWRKQLDLGPEATDLAAVAAYRAFWGDKAHLRRFKDGRIIYCVFWDRPDHSRHLILQDIAQFVLHTDTAFVIGGPLDGMLQCVQSPQPEKGPLQLQHAQTLWSSFETTWDRLRTALMKLGSDEAELPLRIQTVRKMDESLSATSIRVPVVAPAFAKNVTIMDDSAARRSPPFVDVCRVILQFESSGAWPEDLPAIERVKTALLLKLAESLMDKYKASVSAVQVNSSFLDVFIDGYVFRLLVFYPREIFIRSAQQQSDYHRCYQLWFHFEERPRLTTSIRALNSRYPAYGATSQLVKRWLASQLIPVVADGEFPQDTASQFSATSLGAATADVLPELLVDLLVAHVFTTGNFMSFVPPSHHHIGFLRVLEMLAKFPFNSQALVVDWDGQLRSADHELILQDFESSRTTGGSQAGLYLAYASPTGSGSEGVGSTAATDVESWLRPASWRRILPGYSIFGASATSNQVADAAPSTFVISRISALAAEMLNLVRHHSAEDNQILGGFVPSTTNFDVVIKLRSNMIVRWHQNVSQLVRAHLSASSSEAVSSALRELTVKHWHQNRQALGIKLDIKAPKFKNLVAVNSVTSTPADLLVGFDPVRLFASYLRTRYDGVVHVLYDDLGGDVICLKWKAKAFTPHKNLRLSSAISTLPVSIGPNKFLIMPNILQILQDIRCAAPDLVESVNLTA